MKDVVFLSGLPRSGSTVLASMINQHPELHATTTSPVADLISITLDTWPNISRALNNPNKNQFGNILKGIINGAHQHIEKNIVLDKNRLWPRFAQQIQNLTESNIKIVCTVRSISDIMASYILLIEKNKDQVTFVDRDLLEQNLPVNNKNRCRILLEKYINHPYNSLKIGFNSVKTNMLFLEYDDIVRNGQASIDKVCHFLEIDTFKIDVNNLQRMDENDHFHGGLVGLHDVRSKLEKVSPGPEKVIGHETASFYNSMKLEFWR